MSTLKRLLTAKKGVKGDTVQLEEAIYNAVKLKPVRSLDAIIEASRNFTVVLEKLKAGKVKDFDTVNNAYLKLVSEFTAEGPRNKRKFHPSSLRHDCERKLYYLIGGFRFTDQVVDDIDGKLQMIFDQGHWFHSYVQSALMRAGILLRSEVPIKSEKRFLDGRMDGLILWKDRKMALEIKTMNSFRFAVGKLNPFEDNVYQNSFYADHLGISHIVFLYFNKDTCEVAIHIKPVNKTMARLANEKIDAVLDSVAEGVPPRRSCKTMRSEGAKTCPFRSRCFK